MRDAGFSRQRYWGEPFPDCMAGRNTGDCKEALPLELPHVDKMVPGAEGEGPGKYYRMGEQIHPEGRRETSTMPGYAGQPGIFAIHGSITCWILQPIKTALLEPGGFIHWRYRTCRGAFVVQPHVDESVVWFGIDWLWWAV